MANILLVEDTRKLAEGIKRELIRDGHTVTTAFDGETALRFFQQDPPDLIILDWMLPKKDGLSVLRTIRASSDIPILMLSARGEAVDRVIGLEVGADDYLTKPFDPHELQARIHALLRRMTMIEKAIANDKTPPQEKLSFGPFELIPTAHQILQDGTPLDLSRLEFDLMTLFLKNPGRVFSRTYLIETIWDETYLPGDRSVDNAILRLRSKLGKDGQLIETVWGVGYRLRRKP